MKLEFINREGYEHVVLTNNKGMIVELSPVGASIYDIILPNKNGEAVSIVLKPSYMENYKNSYHGKTIGRFSGRIDKGVCTIGGKEYNLDINWCDVNSLHGGFKGLSSQVCQTKVNEFDTYTEVIFTYVEDAHMLPGEVSYEIKYHIMNDINEITTILGAETTEETVVNMTNHTYFNLSGNCKNTVLNHNLYFQCDKYTRLNNELITITIDPVNEVMDFRDNHPIGKYIEDPSLQNHKALGYDHCFIKEDESNPLLAIVKDNESGIGLTISSSYPSVVFYSGCYPDSYPFNEDKITNIKYHAFCLEPQFIPNGINMEGVEKAILKPGEAYSHYIKYSFE